MPKPKKELKNSLAGEEEINELDQTVKLIEQTQGLIEKFN